MKSKLTNSTLILFIIIIYFSSNCNAQRTLTLGDAIGFAMEHNVTIAKAENMVRESKNSAVTSYLQLLPSLIANGQARRASGTNFDEITGTVSTSTGNFYNAAINVNWDILNLLRRVSVIKAAKNNVQANKHSKEASKDLVVLLIIDNYLEILQNIQQDKIFQEFYTIQEKNLNRTMEMVKLGSLPAQDELIQKAELSRLKAAIVENRRIQNEQINKLKLMLSIDPGEHIVLQNIERTAPQITSNDNTISDFYSEALNNREDLLQRRHEVLNLKHLLNIRRADYYPQINLFYTYGTSFSSFQEQSFDDQFFKNNITNSFGVLISIPIFDGMRVRNSVFRAKIAHENAKLDLEQYKRTVYVEISNAKNALISSSEEILYRQDQEQSMSGAFELEQEKYYLGAGNPQDFEISRRNYIEAALLLNQIEYQQMYNAYALDYYLGKIYSNEKDK
ncbi:TolC family protein [Aquimarina intermedia]|uniref:Outer membrane protein TolC n=1 Tax=Aquimarina intermedia TaxID=350814 RepID=A0A5S5C7G9_9FLAO|nr:TolC family protein [Aquimarina intermedia]TYP74336.1 outer membrane protein TolC [Aquimarina intermedia]